MDETDAAVYPTVAPATATGDPPACGVIYALADPATAEIRYIGKTVNLAARVRDHNKRRRGGAALLEWLGGLSGTPIVLVLEEGITPEQLDQTEAAYIAEYRIAGAQLVNVGDGGINGRYDHAERRQSVRRGRERGCWIYLPLAELSKTGVDVAGPAPFYRVWGAARGRVVVQLYGKKN